MNKGPGKNEWFSDLIAGMDRFIEEKVVPSVI